MLTHWANWWFKRNEWKFMGTLPKRKAKVVLVVGPHSSFKDFILILACMKLTHMQFEFILDSSDFTWYVRPLLTALRAKKMTVQNSAEIKQECIDQMKQRAHACFGVTTNAKNNMQLDAHPFFYDIAYKSGASVVLIGIDHHRKLVKFHNPFHLSGNEARDLQYIRGFFENFFSYERQQNSLKR